MPVPHAYSQFPVELLHVVQPEHFGTHVSVALLHTSQRLPHPTAGSHACPTACSVSSRASNSASLSTLTVHDASDAALPASDATTFIQTLVFDFMICSPFGNQTGLHALRHPFAGALPPGAAAHLLESFWVRLPRSVLRKKRSAR
jgi:hypothetical protein